ncbi:MAG: acetyltransferase [Actinobacteria bacterium]|nr:acetyltransferase [Actinomycetota bacterium]
MKKIGIIGFSSFTREIICNLKQKFDIFISDSVYNSIPIETITKNHNCNVHRLKQFDTTKYDALLTIANINLRSEIVKQLPPCTNYYTYIDKRAIIMDKNMKIGKGSIICAGAILTTNVTLGEFSQINLNSTIGHDTVVGDYFTCAPGVNISGNCSIGCNVYIGTNATIKDNIKICNGVVIGMNAGVVKNIATPGTYIGTPCEKMK